MFQFDDDELKGILRRMRETLLQAASTIQYDTATLPAEQLGVDVLPEMFTKSQQMQSRMDGQLEMDGETRRDH